MVNFLRSIIFSIWGILDDVVSFLTSSLGDLTGFDVPLLNDVTVIGLVLGTGLVISLTWAIVKFWVGF